MRKEEFLGTYLPSALLVTRVTEDDEFGVSEMNSEQSVQLRCREGSQQWAGGCRASHVARFPANGPAGRQQRLLPELAT